ncbi:hypothetical protein KUTeg_015701 [Tegillarca granosa]|uniref:C2 domain-containing protein n=1 Tax=Tegillarca granosa TaxID=220873 RepID=A0ABQ9ETD9_TEGGR|nr:hypothetical protein KUTeg_015701 [Tegillarca granosa]
MFDVLGMSDNVMVSLEQHDIKPGRQSFGRTLNHIGFQIMKVEVNRKYRVHLNEDINDLIYKSEYLKSRSVFGVLKLMKGRYVIIPTTREPGEIGPFMLRLYTGSKSSGKELTEEGPSKGCLCFKSATLVTTLTVISAEELELPTGSKVKSLDPYVVIRCEGEKIQSESRTNTKNPEWNLRATFYRKKPMEPIVIEVWNDNVLIDDFLGEGREFEEGSEDGTEKTLELYGRKKEADMIKPGKLKIKIRSSHDLQYL